MMMFNKGDDVTWRSQAKGYTKTKTGRVVHILRGDINPVTVAKKHFPDHKRMFEGMSIPGSQRRSRQNALGYLVEVSPGAGWKNRLYMPYPSKLVKVWKVCNSASA